MLNFDSLTSPFVSPLCYLYRPWCDILPVSITHFLLMEINFAYTLYMCSGVGRAEHNIELYNSLFLTIHLTDDPTRG